MWIVITLAATIFQIARTSEQHRLREKLEVAKAGYVRFVYAQRLAVAITVGWMLGPGDLPDLGLRFWLSVTAAASAPDSRHHGAAPILPHPRLRGRHHLLEDRSAFRRRRLGGGAQ